MTSEPKGSGGWRLCSQATLFGLCCSETGAIGEFEVMGHHKRVCTQGDSSEVGLEGAEAGGGNVSGEA